MGWRWMFESGVVMGVGAGGRGKWMELWRFVTLRGGKGEGDVGVDGTDRAEFMIQDGWNEHGFTDLVMDLDPRIRCFE